MWKAGLFKKMQAEDKVLQQELKEMQQELKELQQQYVLAKELQQQYVLARYHAPYNREDSENDTKKN